MGAVSFSFLDLIVVAIVIVSTIFAIYRGFVRETLSVFAWAVAAFATIYFSPAAIPVTRSWFGTSWLADAVAYAGVFLVVLIPLSFVSYRLSEGVRHSPVGTLDRSLGIVFGLLRGLVLVAIAYIVFSLIVVPRDQPGWVRHARLLPLIQSSSEVVLSLLPRGQASHVATRDRAPRHTTTDAASNRASHVTPKPKPAIRQAAEKPVPKARHKTYGADERHALDNLIEATGNGGKSKP